MGLRENFLLLQEKMYNFIIATNKNLTHLFNFLCSVEKLRSAVAIVEPQTLLAMPGARCYIECSVSVHLRMYAYSHLTRSR